MSAFSQHKMLNASPALIPDMASAICQEFQRDGYEVNIENLYSGGKDISITKGGAFKAVLGMKTALKVTLQPRADAVSFDAGVGIFGLQALPTVISMFFFWPVLITQIWGMIEQANLDDRALMAAQSVAEHSSKTQQNGQSFCTTCGKAVAKGMQFCPYCGAKLA